MEMPFALGGVCLVHISRCRDVGPGCPVQELVASNYACIR